MNPNLAKWLCTNYFLWQLYMRYTNLTSPKYCIFCYLGTNFQTVAYSMLAWGRVCLSYTTLSVVLLLWGKFCPLYNLASIIWRSKHSILIGLRSEIWLCHCTSSLSLVQPLCYKLSADVIFMLHDPSFRPQTDGLAFDSGNVLDSMSVRCYCAWPAPAMTSSYVEVVSVQEPIVTLAADQLTICLWLAAPDNYSSS